jgi:hypothetical protein
MALDDDGQPVAVFAPCEGTLTGISFEESGTPDERIERWDLSTADDVREFDVFAESDTARSDPRTFVIYAWAAHSGGPFGETKNLWWIEFTTADLQTLEPGQVLFLDTSGDFELTTGSPSTFEAIACPDE